MKLSVSELQFNVYYLGVKTMDFLEEEITEFIESRLSVLDLQSLVDFVGSVLQSKHSLKNIEIAEYLEYKSLTIKDLLMGKIDYNELLKDIAYDIVSTLDIDLSVKPIKE